MIARGLVHVDLPADRALELFTPRGEELWVEDWRPRFPGGDVDDTAVGTVFVTESEGRETVWIVADRSKSFLRYTRVTPGLHAGTVLVHCHVAGDDAATAEVTYDLTALSAEGVAWLLEFAAGYAGAMAEWEERIAAVVPDFEEG